jgi:hypothetical protein
MRSFLGHPFFLFFLFSLLDPPVSAFSLSLYRHPFLYTLFRSRFTLIINIILYIKIRTTVVLVWRCTKTVVLGLSLVWMCLQKRVDLESGVCVCVCVCEDAEPSQVSIKGPL